MPFPDNWQTIQFDDVSFTYGDENVLSGINLTVERGEIIALVGASGSGKSTMVNLLQRFFDPTEGEIRIDNIALRKMSLSELRHSIALVTQDVFLFNDTIEENIYAGSARKEPERMKQAARMANAQAFIERLPKGFKTPVGDHGARLSGGERQRISIARAVYKNAPILILDEATSALDSASELEVQKGLDQLMKGRTAFVIAHRLSTVVHADRILVLRHGRVIEQGSHHHLLDQKGEYFRFFELQANHTKRVASLR